VTTFWKPIKGAGPLPAGSHRLKALGSGLYQLWARCDLCHDSAPFDQFVLWERGDDVGSLCSSCDSRSDIAPELQADGWRRCG
jgi:hypothetical protein